MNIEQIKNELKRPLIDFMDWYRTHPEYENVVSSTLVDLWLKSEEECNCNVGITNVFHKGKCIKCKKKVVKHKPTIGGGS